MEILGGVASSLVEMAVGAFVSFCRARGRRHSEAEQFRAKLLQTLSRVENLASYGRISEFFSEAQLQGIFQRFSMPGGGREAVAQKQREIMDFISPPVGEVSEIKAFIESLCQLLFEYANPVNEDQRGLLNRIDADVVLGVREEVRNVREGFERQLAEQMPSRSMQVLPIEQFIQTKNASTINATLDHSIYHRDAEIGQAIQLLSDARALVLSGFPGVGKTRLALEIARKISEAEDRQAFCIHGNGIELYHELQRELKDRGRYILLVDDANEFSYLPHILNYLAPNAGQIDAKGIITVRNYAKEKVVDAVQRFVATSELKLEPLKADKITDMLRGEFPGFSNFVVEQITRISQGNPRFALMGAQCVQKEQNLSGIRNATELYNTYYQTVLSGNPIWHNRTNVCTVAIIAMAGVVDMERMDSLTPLLTACGVTTQAVQESVGFLHQTEIADLCLDRAVKIPDQCLADYLTKKVLLEDRWIPLRTFIEVMFDRHRNALIRTVDMLLNVFHQDDIVQEIADEVKSIWQDWEADQDPRLWEFIAAFHQIDPIQALKAIKDRIDESDWEEFNVSNISFSEKRNNEYISDELLNVLSGYRYDHTKVVAQLILRYYLKRPSLYMQVYHCCCRMTCPNEFSHRTGLCIQNDLADEMYKLVLEKRDENTMLLCGRIALHMISLWFSETYSRDEKTIVFARMCMIETEKGRQYRDKLWEIILLAFDNAALRSEIMSFLEACGSRHEELETEVVLGDWPSIRRLIAEKMHPDSLSDSITLDRLKRHLTKIVPAEQFNCMEAFFQTPEFKMEQLLMAEDRELEYQERINAKQSQLEKYAHSMTENEIPVLLATSAKLINNNGTQTWMLQENLATIFLAMGDRPEMQRTLTNAYIQAGAPLGFLPELCLQNLIRQFSFSALWEMLEAVEIHACESLYFQILSLVPDGQISQEHLHALGRYFQQHPLVTSSPSRSLRFLVRYQAMDSKILRFVLTSIIEQGKKNPILLRIYDKLAFHDDFWLLEACKNEQDLLIDFYMASILSDNYLDYEGKYFLVLIKLYPEYLERFIKEMLDCAGKRDAYIEKLATLAETDEHSIYAKVIINHIMDSTDVSMYEKGELFEKLFNANQSEPDIDRIDSFLDLLSDNCKDDPDRIEVLFQTLNDLPRPCRRYGIVTWLKSRPSSESLKKTYLGNRGGVWSGSLIPVYEAEIQFFEGILSEFEGADDLDGAAAIQRQIASLRKQVKQETLDEFMTDR